MNIFLAITTYFLLSYSGLMALFFLVHAFVPGAPQIFGFLARCMSGYLTLMVSAAYGFVASSILRPFGLHFRYGQWTTARCFKWLGLLATGVKFEVVDNGRELLDRKRPYVVVVNHQTELDILALGAIWPQYCSVTAKKSLRNVPFLGWYMSMSGTVFIDRVDRTAALKAFDGAAKTMKNLGQSILPFPEGTRSYSAEPMLLPFKKGAFHLAVQAGADILPVVCENYSKVLNIKAKRFEAGTVRIKVLDPIPTKGMTAQDVDTLTRETREKMLKTLIELGSHSNAQVVNPLKQHAL